MTDIVVKGRQAQLFRVSHFNPAGIALTSFFQMISIYEFLFSSSVKIQQYLLIEKLSFILFQIIVQRADLNRRRSLNR
jgi:hypothetical protein